MNFKGNIISAGNNAKTIKGDGKEYVTAIFYGTPFKLLSILLAWWLPICFFLIISFKFSNLYPKP